MTDYTITISGLRRDLDFLRDRGYVTILPRELAAGQLDDGAPLPQKAVLLTFDDGYVSNFTLALPLLREYGAKAAVSLITARIDEGTSGFLAWDECREMVKAGLSSSLPTPMTTTFTTTRTALSAGTGNRRTTTLRASPTISRPASPASGLKRDSPSPPSPTRSAKWNRGRSLFCSSSFPSRSPAFTAKRATAIRSIICRASTSVIATPQANTCAALEMISFGVLVS